VLLNEDRMVVMSCDRLLPLAPPPRSSRRCRVKLNRAAAGHNAPTYWPPMKPSGPWSKLSPPKSSIIVPFAPDAMNGLTLTLSSKKTAAPPVV